MTYEVAIYSTRRKDEKKEEQKKKFFLGRNPFVGIATAAAEKEQLGKSEREVLEYLNTVIYEAEYEDDKDTVSKNDLVKFRLEKLPYEVEEEKLLGTYDNVKIAFKRPAGSPALQPASSVRSLEGTRRTDKSKTSANGDTIDNTAKATRRHTDSASHDEMAKRKVGKNVKRSNTSASVICPTIRGFDGFMMY